MSSPRSLRFVLASSLCGGLLLSACGSSAHGIVAGSLRVLGGPVVVGSGKGYLSAGRAVLSDVNGAKVTINIDSSGRFLAKVAPGTYRVVAGTKAMNYRGCFATGGNTITVAQQRVSNLDITCSIR